MTTVTTGRTPRAGFQSHPILEKLQQQQQVDKASLFYL